MTVKKGDMMGNNGLIEIFSRKKNNVSVTVYQQCMDENYKTQFLKGEMCCLVMFSPFLNEVNRRFVTVTDEIFDDVELKRKYRGQTFNRFPLTYDSNKNRFTITDNEDGSDVVGYVAVSKRDIRTAYPELRLALTEDIRKRSQEIAETFIGKYNALSNGRVYTVEFVCGDSKQVNTDVMAVDDAALRKYLSDNIPFIGEDVDEMISNIVLD